MRYGKTTDIYLIQNCCQITPAPSALSYPLLIVYGILSSLYVGFTCSKILHHRHIQLLADQLCLLVVSNGQGETGIFIDKYRDIPHTVEKWKCKKRLHEDKMGSEFLVALDETKHMLAILAIEKVCGAMTHAYHHTLLTQYRFLFSTRCRFTSLYGMKSTQLSKDLVPPLILNHGTGQIIRSNT